MDKRMLKCDICGGTLKMQANREAVCESCGMAYSVESLREKFDGLKVSVTGSSRDVEQWKALVQTYLNRHDFAAAEGTVKKILEASPSDEYANNMYSLLQEWKYLEIVNGTLIRYSGRAHEIILPEGIQTIGESAFKDSTIRSITLPNTLINIEDCAFEGCHNLCSIQLPKSVVHIGDYAFKNCSSIESIDMSNVENCGMGCLSSCVALTRVVLYENLPYISDHMFERTALVEIDLPSRVTKIGNSAFQACFSLRRISLPDSLQSIGWAAFSHCHALSQVSIPSTVNEIQGRAFEGCEKLSKMEMPDALLSKMYRDYCTRDQEGPNYDPLGGVPWWNNYIEQKARENRRNRAVCQYCGGEFKGLFTKVCSKCGKTKDY